MNLKDILREIIIENLRNWFKKEKWKRIDTQGNIAGDCGTMPKGKLHNVVYPQLKHVHLLKNNEQLLLEKK